MTLSDILALAALALGGWFVWDALKVREIANRAMRAACETEGLMFLDDTVGLRSIRPVRDEAGRLRLRRIYAFEYSDTGENRRQGSITLVGDKVAVMNIGLWPIRAQQTLH